MIFSTDQSDPFLTTLDFSLPEELAVSLPVELKEEKEVLELEGGNAKKPSHSLLIAF